MAARTIQYMTQESTLQSPRLDAVAAVAVALGLHPWELLAPNLNLDDRPALTTARAVEAEVSRRVAERMQELQGQVSRLLMGAGVEQGTDSKSTNGVVGEQDPSKGEGHGGSGSDR